MTALFVMGFLMTFQPAFSELSSQIRIPVTKYKLKNGLTVLLNPDSQTTTASYYLGITTGSRHEKPGITGISHIFEHLMFKGTKKFPKIDTIYRENGVTGLNAHTSKDYTGYFAGFPEDKLQLILDVESDRMVNLQFSEEDLKKEKKVVQEERRLSIDNSPYGQLFEKAFELVFKEHPYRWPILGWAKDIAGYTTEDLTNWYDTYYSPGNAVLVLSGRFSEEKAKKLIEKYFGPLPSKKIPKERTVIEPEQLQPRFADLERNVPAHSVLMAWRTPGHGSKEASALSAVSYILGAGESGRLYRRLVRKQGLLQDISCSVLNLLQGSVFFVTYTLPEPAMESRIKQEILKELERIWTEGVSREELEKVKNIQFNKVIGQLKKSGSRANRLAVNELRFGDYEKLYFNLDQLETLSPDFIKTTAQKHLTGNKISYLKLKPKKGK